MKNLFYLTLAVALFTASCKQEGRVTGVKLDKKDVELAVGESIDLKAIVIPLDATEKTVYWYSENQECVTVDKNGNITAIAPAPSARIEVSTKDGNFKDYCTVKVIQLLPVLTTNEVTTFTSATAILGGNITNAGAPPYTERGICYSTTSNPTINNNKTPISGSGSGSFNKEITGLAANAKYYVRAYAINNEGTVYGNEVNFTTLGNISYILGEYRAKGYSYFFKEEEWDVIIKKDETDVSKVWIRNFAYEGGASTYIYATVNPEKTEIRIPMGQATIKSEDAFLTGWFVFYNEDGSEDLSRPDEDYDIPDGYNMVVYINDDGNKVTLTLPPIYEFGSYETSSGLWYDLLIPYSKANGGYDNSKPMITLTKKNK